MDTIPVAIVMGVWGFGSAESDHALDLLMDIQDEFDLVDSDTREPLPDKRDALVNVTTKHPLVGDGFAASRIAVRLLQDGYRLHASVLQAAADSLEEERDSLATGGDTGWCVGGAKKRLSAIRKELRCIRRAILRGGKLSKRAHRSA